MNRKSNITRMSALLIVAIVNIFGLISSGHLQQIRTVDAARLLLSGLLIGVALGQLRVNRASGPRT
jgi:hypothetical protein